MYLLNELAGNSFMVFCDTCANTQRVALMLRNLGFTAIPLHGQMTQVFSWTLCNSKLIKLKLINQLRSKCTFMCFDLTFCGSECAVYVECLWRLQCTCKRIMAGVREGQLPGAQNSAILPSRMLAPLRGLKGSTRWSVRRNFHLCSQEAVWNFFLKTTYDVCEALLLIIVSCM